jgi:hypothetical protein
MSKNTAVVCMFQSGIVKCGYYPAAYDSTHPSLSVHDLETGEFIRCHFDTENPGDREALRRLSAQLAEIVRDINNTYGERK